MAEGDTIHRAARMIGAALAGAPVSAQAPGPRRPHGLPPARLDGRALERAEARGKHLLLHFEDDLALHSHLGMRGSWEVYGPGAGWRRPRRSAWLALAGPRGQAVNFNGSTLRLVGEAALARDPRLARLGPDVLSEDFDPEAGARALASGGPDREIGDALLDQGLLSGIGNIFKSEACFAARVDPWRPVGELDASELRQVAAAASGLMRGALEGGRRPGAVYGRAGRPCGRCGARIRARPQGDGARRTYWCPACQE